jgi:hypothetical protein
LGNAGLNCEVAGSDEAELAAVTVAALSMLWMLTLEVVLWAVGRWSDCNGDKESAGSTSPAASTSLALVLGVGEERTERAALWCCVCCSEAAGFEVK